MSILGLINSPIFFVFCCLDYFWTPSGQVRAPRQAVTPAPGAQPR